MKDEVSSAAKFLADKLKERPEISSQHGELFRTTVEALMCSRFENHWHPNKPLKGNAFRCLNINLEECCLDPLLKEAAGESNVDVDDLTACFPGGLALWIDPYDVSYRLGRGAICPIFRRYNPCRTQPSLPHKRTKFQSRKVHHEKTTFGRPQMDAVNFASQLQSTPNYSQDSQLNSLAPEFTPKVNQNLSSIWAKKWQSNSSMYNFQQKADEYYTNNFQRNPDQDKYNRFNWHKEESQQQNGKPLTGFEFHNYAQEVY